MEVQEIEETIVEDKPLSDMSIEELEQAYDRELSGQTEDSDPDNNETEDVALEAKEEDGPVKVDDSEEATSENDSKNDPMSAMAKQMEGMQKLLAKFGTEQGDFRKFVESVKNGELNQSSQNEDEEDIDPYTDADKFIDKKLADRERDQLKAQEKINQTINYVKGRVPKFEDMKDTMANELKSLLADDPDVDVYVNNFKANPYVVDPLTLLFMGKSAELREEIAQLQGKVSNSANSKGDLIKKVNSLGRSKGVVSGGANGSTSANVNSSLTGRQIESMSLEDLTKAYKQETENNQ